MELDISMETMQDGGTGSGQVMVGALGPHEITENEGSQWNSDCLGISLVIKGMMEHFSNTELLQLSLVNKQWNTEARRVLKNRKNLIARIGSDRPCRRLADFASDVLKMPIVPFSGISVQMSHVHDCDLSRNGILDASYNVILEQLQWKHLSVKIRGSCNKYKDCHALLLVKKVFEDFSSSLEEISFALNQQLEFFQEYLQGRQFPRLKTLKMEWVINYNGHSQNFLKSLVPLAPNLEEVHLNRAIDLEENVLEGSSAVLVVASKFNPFNVQVCERIVGDLRLKKFEIYRPRYNFNVEILSGIIPKLLEASHTAISTLKMDLLFAAPLTCYGICLENVTELEIDVGFNCKKLLEPPFRTLKGFNFTRVFPKLNQVTVVNKFRPGFTEQEVSGFVERGNAVLREGLPDRAINIKHLATVGCISKYTLDFFAQMFPNVKSLAMEARHYSEFEFEFLRRYFVSLKIVQYEK